MLQDIPLSVLLLLPLGVLQRVSEYDQDIPQSNTADQPTAP